MKTLYKSHNVVIREKEQGLVEVIEDGEYGPGTDREGMPYSRIVGAFTSVALAHRSFPHAHVDMSFAEAFAAHTAKAADKILSHAPHAYESELEPDPTFDAAHEICYDDQGVPY
jgi:hypothetical protein